MNPIKYKPILEGVRHFKVFPKKEKNIFDLGGKGHYENQISDILAFYLNSKAEHNLTDLCLKSLSECIEPNCREKIINLDGFENVKREEPTKDEKLIDILVLADNWTITIENKIKAKLQNPLDSYYEYINNKYSKKKNYFVILSMNEINVKKPWININYADFISKIKSNLGNYILNKPASADTKWLVLFREFLLNLTNQLGGDIVDNQIIRFVSQNYNDIVNLIKYRDNFLEWLKKECAQITSEVFKYESIEQAIQEWDNASVLRTYLPGWWGEKTNITMVVKNEGYYEIRVYFYADNVQEKKVEEFKISFIEYEFKPEKNPLIYCVTSGEVDGVDNAKEKFKEMAIKLKQVSII